MTAGDTGDEDERMKDEGRRMKAENDYERVINWEKTDPLIILHPSPSVRAGALAAYESPGLHGTEQFWSSTARFFL